MCEERPHQPIRELRVHMEHRWIQRQWLETSYKRHQRLWCSGWDIHRPTIRLACLKNKDSNLAAMPNLNQVEALMQAYSPWIYFHPNEAYLPSLVSWFFNNDALLYQRGNQNPTPIDSNGSNLPQGSSNDGAYWIDLLVDDGQKDKIKKGDISSTKVYLHIKLALLRLGSHRKGHQQWLRPCEAIRLHTALEQRVIQD